MLYLLCHDVVLRNKKSLQFPGKLFDFLFQTEDFFLSTTILNSTKKILVCVGTYQSEEIGNLGSVFTGEKQL